MRSTVAVVAVVALAAGQASAQVGYEDLGDFLAAAPYATNLNDFESYASGTQITNLPGITSVQGFTTNGGPLTDVFVFSQNDFPFGMLVGQNTSSPVNLLSNNPNGPVFATGTIEMTFASDQNAIGFYVADGSPLDTFNITLFDGAAMVASVNSASFLTLPDSFFGVVSDTPFDRVVFGSNSPFDSWGIDDLRFGAIPAPGAMAVLALGTLAARRRRAR